MIQSVFSTVTRREPKRESQSTTTFLSTSTSITSFLNENSLEREHNHFIIINLSHFPLYVSFKVIAMASLESVLTTLLKEEVARSKQLFATEQLALRLLSCSAIPAARCQTVESAPMSSLPILSALQSKVAASVEIQRQLSRQQKSEQLLLNYQLLVAAQRKKQEQQQHTFSLPFVTSVCNGVTSDLLSPTVVQQLAFDAGNKRSLEEMVMTYQAVNKRIRVQEEEKKNQLPTVPCRCRGMPDDHNPKVRPIRDDTKPSLIIFYLLFSVLTKCEFLYYTILKDRIHRDPRRCTTWSSPHVLPPHLQGTWCSISLLCILPSTCSKTKLLVATQSSPSFVFFGK
jgi:hypothetical protein